jgi:malonyl-CoA O-methyltransferase
MSVAPIIDTRQVRRNFARAAGTYDAVAVLQREVGSRMLERLDYVKIAPQRVLDLGCGTGAGLGALSERYPRAQVVGADLSEAMLRVARDGRSRLRFLLPFLRGKRSSLLAADALALPVRSGALGMVWSNLMLHWVADPLAVFREMQRTLEVGGLLMFSTFGPDTLKELRASFSDGYAHCQRFTDMHDYGDMLVEAGFADPVMDAEVLTMTYPNFDGLIRDLRQSGSTCTMHERRRGLTGRSAWLSARANYEKRMIDERLPASFEVVYGHAWKVAAKTTADGAAIVRFDPRKRLR